MTDNHEPAYADLVAAELTALPFRRRYGHAPGGSGGCGWIACDTCQADHVRRARLNVTVRLSRTTDNEPA